MTPDRVINVHGHIHRTDDLRARVRLWEQWRVARFCCACLRERWSKPESGGYFTNQDFLAARRQYGDILVGLAAVNLTAAECDTPSDVQRYRDLGFEGLKFIDNDRPYSHEVHFPLYEKAAGLGMPILFHTGYVAACGDGSDAKFGIDSEHLRPYHFDRIARRVPHTASEISAAPPRKGQAA